MAYKFNRSSTGDFGEKGAAIVKVSEAKGLFRVEFRDGGKHTLKLDKKPEQLTEGRWKVSLNGDETEVFSFHPYAGSFQGQVKKFASKEGEPPQFWESKGKYPDWMFTVIIGITNPKNLAGVEVPYFLRNRFTEEKDEEGKSWIGIGKGKHGDNLLKFLRITGVEERGAMPFKSNPLPMVEKRVLHEPKEFGFIISDGWISDVFPLNANDGLEWDGD